MDEDQDLVVLEEEAVSVADLLEEEAVLDETEDETEHQDHLVEIEVHLETEHQVVSETVLREHHHILVIV